VPSGVLSQDAPSQTNGSDRRGARSQIERLTIHRCVGTIKKGLLRCGPGPLSCDTGSFMRGGDTHLLVLNTRIPRLSI
jgi:hypothetical protein